jgi:hypothetical protein
MPVRGEGVWWLTAMALVVGLLVVRIAFDWR